MRHVRFPTSGLFRLSLAAVLTAAPAAARAATPIPNLRAALDATATTSMALEEGVASPFHLSTDLPSRARAVGCLAQAIYYEAANQPLQGRQAVAQVVLNRLRHPNYPKSVCGVVYQGAPLRGCQFTFACDGALARSPVGDGWRSAMDVAEQALDGAVEPSVGVSTHYHTLAVHPLWSLAMRPTRRIGDHQFYRFAGPLGEAGALVGQYAGLEPTAPFAAGLGVASPRRDRGPASPGSAAFAVWGLPLAVVSARRGVITVAAGPGFGAAPSPKDP